jgi:hypothetical protein
LGLCENEKFRGPIVAAGGGKALLPLALEGTNVGMTKATQALAKIAITTNPEIAFPGQRVSFSPFFVNSISHRSVFRC